jgi:hypothetical protein
MTYANECEPYSKKTIRFEFEESHIGKAILMYLRANGERLPKELDHNDIKLIFDIGGEINTMGHADNIITEIDVEDIKTAANMSKDNGDDDEAWTSDSAFEEPVTVLPCGKDKCPVEDKESDETEAD